MREIKFRAWNPVSKSMFWSYRCKNLSFFFEYVGSIDLADGFALLQYTGLKDKNGKEIYEGDRLHYAGLDGVVIYDENICSFKFKGDGRQVVKFQPIAKTTRQQMEVIGNIYEDPELLEVQPK